MEFGISHAAWNQHYHPEPVDFSCRERDKFITQSRPSKKAFIITEETRESWRPCTAARSCVIREGQQTPGIPGGGCQSHPGSFPDHRSARLVGLCGSGKSALPSRLPPGQRTARTRDNSCTDTTLKWKSNEAHCIRSTFHSDHETSEKAALGSTVAFWTSLD